ncbi:HAMP domain-containing histidine kinase [Aureimonas altamirensis]|uniref:sensor histidine kinase n=1 Tax=Aureimonas altamirensis TaxID=370622 RepID=UPI0020369ED8|nr:HAMP domain-containing sensor histidine kinase [Aureimonas altamirensis]MCM2505080.1 HAMP domain-containing histidine kinase [Aureimonas altamirensis]
MTNETSANTAEQKEGRADRRGARLCGWLRDGLDGLLPTQFEGRARVARLRVLLVFLAVGMGCAALAVWTGAATGAVSRELLLASIACMAGAVVTVSYRLSEAGARPNSAELPAFAQALLADEAISLILILDRHGRILQSVRGPAAGSGFADLVHLRDRVAVLSALASLRKGDARVDLRLRAADGIGASGMRLKLVAMDAPDAAGAVLAVGEPNGAIRPADEESAEAALHSAVRASASKTSLLTAVGQELAVAGRGAGNLPVELLASTLCYLSRVDGGACRVDPTSQPIAPIVESALRTARGEAARKGLRLAVTTAEKGPCVADAEALRLLLGIVFANAVAATPRGEIDIRVATDESGLRLTVTDGGDGLSGCDAEPALNCALLMAQSLCDMHFGRLQTCSRAGIGTVVDCFIPADCQARIAARSTTPTENIVSLTDARKKAPDLAPNIPQAPNRRSA